MRYTFRCKECGTEVDIDSAIEERDKERPCPKCHIYGLKRVWNGGIALKRSIDLCPPGDMGKPFIDKQILNKGTTERMRENEA